jgi:hypothetical protein
MSVFPLYYFPNKDTPPPAHLRRARPVLKLAPDASPNGCPETGGIFVGCAPTPALLAAPIWKKSRFGWWCALGDATPETFHRTEAIPGNLITGITKAHQWHIPALLTYEPGRGYCSALEPVYLDGAWRIPARFADLIDRLVNTFQSVLGDVEPSNDEKLALAVEILTVNYHVTIAELEHFEWLTPDLCWKICACTIKAVGEEQSQKDTAAQSSGSLLLP